MYTHSGPLSKGQRGGGRQYRDTQDLSVNIGGEVETQRTDTQDLYPEIRGEVETQCTHTQDLYLKVRGEVADTVQTLWTSI